MQIIFKDTVTKKLGKINPPDLQKIKRKIESLEIDPLAGKPLTGDFSGQRSLRAWPLRIIYEFDPRMQIITITTIDYRGNVYK